MINFQCPNCSQKIEAEDAWGGKRVTCPTCGKTIEIPFSQERINTTIKLSAEDIVNNAPSLENRQQNAQDTKDNVFSNEHNQETQQDVSGFFRYRQIGKKFYVKGDYSVLFAIIEDCLLQNKFQIEEKDINAGYIKIKYSGKHKQFIIFYSEDDEIVIDFAKNNISFFNAINNLISTVDEALTLYKNGQCQFTQKYHAFPPSKFHKYKVDYTSPIRKWVAITPAIYILYYFIIMYLCIMFNDKSNYYNILRALKIGIYVLFITFLLIRIKYIIAIFHSRKKNCICLLIICIFIDIISLRLIDYILTECMIAEIFKDFHIF